MTAAELILWQRVQRRAAVLTPEMAQAVLSAFQIIRDSMDEAKLVRLIDLGFGDRVFDTILSEAVRIASYAPIREQLRRGVTDSFKYFVRDVPVPPSLATVSIGFDILNPNVISAVRALETRVITTLDGSIRETVRAFIENGIRDGTGARAVARDLRAVIGLAPSQDVWVRNYTDAAANAHVNNKALGYELRDKRFDATVAKARRSGVPIPEATQQKMAAAMRRKAIAFNAETNARTATLDSLKLGQRIAWESGVERGVFDRERLQKTWVGVLDARERPTHVAMEGQTVGFDEPFSNGQIIPGDDEYNCRCVARYFVGRA